MSLVSKVFNFFKDHFIWVMRGCRFSSDALHRIRICYRCDSFDIVTEKCKECGCFMRYKTKLKTAKCPLKKW